MSGEDESGSGGARPQESSARAKAGAAMGRATLLMMAFVLLSRVLGVVREMTLSYLVGQNDHTDIFKRAFAVPDMLYLLVAGGALSTVFVPVFAEYWNEKREEDAWRVFGTTMTVVAIAAAVMVLFMEAFPRPFVRLLNPRFSQEAIDATVPLTRILLPAQWFFFVGGLMMGTLNARQRFLIPAVGPVVYTGSIIAAGILVSFWDRSPEAITTAMTVGALIGAGLGNFLLPVLDLHRSKARWVFGFDLRHPGVRKVGALMLPALLGLSLSQLNQWITGIFLEEGGKFSALNNAHQLTQAPIGIFAQASAIVLLPTISMLAARKEWPQFRTEVSQGIRRIFFLTIPASLLMAVLAEPIIRLLFTGPKYGDPEVRMAANALLYYSLGTFAWSAQAVLARGFYAMQDTKTPVFITTGMVALFTALCFALQGPLDYLGLALATSIVATVNMLLFLAVLRKRVGGLDVRGMAVSALRISVAALLSGAAAWALLQWAERIIPAADTRPGAAAALVLAGGAALGVYVLACRLLRVPELHGIRAMLRRPKKEEPAS